MLKTLKNNRRGRLWLIAVIIAALVSAGFAAYAILNKDDNSKDLTIAEQEAEEIASACKSAIDDDNFCRFASSWTTLGAYTATMETRGANGSGTTTVKDDGKGNSHMIVTSGGTTVTEFIGIGGDSYVKDLTDGAWIKYTGENDLPADNVADDIKIDFETDKPEAERVEYKSLGKEACGNLSCFKYQIIDPTNNEGEQLIWFDDKDYLLRRWQFSGGEGSTTAVFSYDPITITVPSPIKETPAVPSDNMTEEDVQRLLESFQTGQ